MERHRRQLTAMSARAGDVQQQLRETTAALKTAEENHRDINQRLLDAEQNLADTVAAVQQLRGEHEQRRAAHLPANASGRRAGK